MALFLFYIRRNIVWKGFFFLHPITLDRSWLQKILIVRKKKKSTQNISLDIFGYSYPYVEKEQQSSESGSVW